ncbi:MAG: patatin-like phospholipase family protein [Acidobacteria bacterium]|nr:patatin-like phospholipase family protein [Acidobacteriota bacterium]
MTALCFSGGGIRSATFNLGVLQGLAKLGLLGRFDYLSSVSGGGFIAGWLARWIHAAGGGAAGLAAVEEALAAAAPRNPECPEPQQVTHLRQYSNYLTPRLGVLSADTWTLVAIGVRNVLLNWLVLVPLLTAPLLVPLLAVARWPAVPPGSWLRWLVAAYVLDGAGLYFVFRFRDSARSRRWARWAARQGAAPRLPPGTGRPRRSRAAAKRGPPRAGRTTCSWGCCRACSPCRRCSWASTSTLPTGATAGRRRRPSDACCRRAWCGPSGCRCSPWGCRGCGSAARCRRSFGTASRCWRRAGSRRRSWPRCSPTGRPPWRAARIPSIRSSVPAWCSDRCCSDALSSSPSPASPSTGRATSSATTTASGGRGGRRGR